MAKFHIPLPAMLISVVAVGCIAVALVAFLPMYFMANRTTNSMGEDLIDASTRASTNDLIGNIGRTTTAVDLIDLVLDHSSSVELDVPKLQRAFVSLMALVWAQGVNYISLGTELGRFYGLERMPDGRVFYRVRNETYPCRTEFLLPNGLDTSLEIVENPTGKASCTYDPRLRSWYKLNKDVTDVSAAYPYSSSPDLALTFGKRVKFDNGSDWGVVTADFSASSLSTLLHDAEFGKTGKAFLTEVKTKTTLATSTRELLLSNYNSSTITGVVTPIDKLNTDYARVALEVAGDNILTQDAINTRVMKEGYWVSVRDLQETSLMHWRLVIVVPVSDYFSGVHRSRNLTVGITVGMVVVVIVLACLMLPLILIPLGVLRTTVQSAANLETDTESFADGSIITEIDHLQKRVGELSNAMMSFTRYIPKEVVRDMLAVGRGVAELGMEPSHLCCLFSDIVKFTAICESSTPEDLSQLLNAYFSRCVSVLVRHNATVDKFIGDAIMAFWGAPMVNENSEVWACLASLHMQAEIRREVRPIFEEHGHSLAVRIGIHSGTALVGNIGSTDRLSYTALGDTVNVAARLEGCNKLFNSSIMISSATREFISDKNFLIRYLGKIQVVGREKPLPIYEVHAVLNETFAAVEVNHDDGFFPTSDAENASASQLGISGSYSDAHNVSRGMGHRRNSGISHAPTNAHNIVDEEVIQALRKRKGAFTSVPDALAEVKRCQFPLNRFERQAVLSFHQGMLSYQRGPEFLAEALLSFNTCKQHLIACPSEDKRKRGASNKKSSAACDDVEMEGQAMGVFSAPCTASERSQRSHSAVGVEGGPLMSDNVSLNMIPIGMPLQSCGHADSRTPSHTGIVRMDDHADPEFAGPNSQQRRSVNHSKSFTKGNEVFKIHTNVIYMKTVNEMIDRCSSGAWSENVMQNEK